jgi:hypothetical protein
MTTDNTRALVQVYYDCWKQGAGAYDQTRLRKLIAPKLEFASPITPRADAEAFFVGLGRFIKTLKSLHGLQLIAAGDEAAALYDCELIESAPVRTLRCAEFFQISGERIQTIRLVFDASEYRKPRP